MKLGFHGDKNLIQIIEESVSKSQSFIETGSYLGYSIGHIAKKFENKDCYSCEIDSGHFENSQKYCGHLENVSLVKSDAGDFLEEFVSKNKEFLDETYTIWSDAHGSGFEWPLRKEIEVITKNFSNVFLFIDDFLVPERDRFGFDSYSQQVCSLDYISGNIHWNDYELYYPTYEYSDIKESAYHPLRGWGLLTTVENDFDKFEFIERVK